jgi:hypothetical protein
MDSPIPARSVSNTSDLPIVETPVRGPTPTARRFF